VKTTPYSLLSVYNIFEAASSSDGDVDAHVIIRKLLVSIYHGNKFASPPLSDVAPYVIKTVLDFIFNVLPVFICQ
jgi:hypothetical protein